MTTPQHDRRPKAAVALLAIVALFGALMAVTLPASADTAGNLVVTRASTPYQSNVAPNGPLTGLKDGDAITVDVTADGLGSPANVIYGIDARLCRTGLNISLTAQFNASAGNCIANPLSPVSSALVQQPVGPPNTSGSVTFLVGTGAETAATHVGAGTPIVCDSANPCTLWLKESVPTGIIASGNAFVHFDLTFAGTPDAPSARSATGGNTSANVSWAAPANTGNSNLTSYTVTSSPAGGSCTATAPATSCTVTGLTNFTPYTFTVTASNAAGFTSAPSGPSNSVIPGPVGPHITGSQAGNGSATILFAPASPAPANGYSLTGGGSATCTIAAPFSCSVTGLTNGTPYTFTVVAEYPGNPVSSDNTATVTPTGQFVTQTFSVTRPAGALVIGEDCSTTTPLADPLGYDLGVTAKNCDVAFGPAVLNVAATYYESTVAIKAVKVLDTRDTDVGWTVTGSLTPFSGPGGDTFGACNFGLAPVAAGASTTPTYTQSIAAGTAVAPDCTAPTGGFGTNRLLMEADAGGGLGYSDLTGVAAVQVPLSANADTYTAVLTFTLITK